MNFWKYIKYKQNDEKQNEDNQLSSSNSDRVNNQESNNLNGEGQQSNFDNKELSSNELLDNYSDEEEISSSKGLSSLGASKNISTNSNDNAIDNQENVFEILKKAEEQLNNLEYHSIRIDNIDKIEFTLLSSSQVFGPNKLDLDEDILTKSLLTDLAFLLTGYPLRPGIILQDENRLESWWTRTPYFDNKISYKSLIAICVNPFGYENFSSIYDCNNGIRIAFYSPIINEFKNKVVEYGEYPQSLVDESLSQELSNKYFLNELEKTGKTYTINFKPEGKKSFVTYVLEEFIYEDNKYMNYNGIWIKVEPITWLIDKKHNIAVTEKLLLFGLPIHNLDEKRNYYTENFENTNLYAYLNNCFAKEIIPSKQIISNSKIIKKVPSVQFEIHSLRDLYK